MQDLTVECNARFDGGVEKGHPSTSVSDQT